MPCKISGCDSTLRLRRGLCNKHRIQEARRNGVGWTIYKPKEKETKRIAVPFSGTYDKARTHAISVEICARYGL